MSGYLLKFKQTYSVKIGGRRYPAVKIGNQLWMAENLDYAWSGLSIGGNGTPTTAHAWYYSNNKSSYGIDGTYKCGLLYNWYAVKYLNDNKDTLLPNGWYVPTESEWDSLTTYIGASTAGTKLKALNNSITGSWPSTWNGTDDYGFSEVPGGYYDGGFYGDGTRTRVWTADEDTVSTGKAYDRTFDFDRATIGNGWINKNYGDYLRLVKSLE